MEKKNLVYNKRLSTVVPARMTTEENKILRLTNMDLAMKLHYLRGVYLFKKEAIQGLNIYDLKKPFFPLLDLYYPAAGRIRVSPENGNRPEIKCNDSGVRIVEAECDKTVEEWMDMVKVDSSLDEQLTYNHVIGPDLGCSPFVFVQFTWFKCGGISVGLSWSHIIGDVFSASTFINMFGQTLGGHLPSPPPKAPKKYQQLSFSQNPFSLKSIEPVGNYWECPNNYNMETHSFFVTEKQLSNLLFKICGISQPTGNFGAFEVMCAVIWRSLSRIRGKSEPKIVTICSNKYPKIGSEMIIPSNNQVVSTVEATSIVANADVLELVNMIAEKKVNETEMIGEFVDKDNGNSDFEVYGANLTFVNLEKAKIYEFKLKGQKSIYANYRIDGVGDKGLVLLLPGLEDGEKHGDGGRKITMIMPKYEVEELKAQLKNEWNIC